MLDLCVLQKLIYLYLQSQKSFHIGKVALSLSYCIPNQYIFFLSFDGIRYLQNSSYLVVHDILCSQMQMCIVSVHRQVVKTKKNYLSLSRVYYFIGFVMFRICLNLFDSIWEINAFLRQRHSHIFIKTLMATLVKSIPISCTTKLLGFHVKLVKYGDHYVVAFDTDINVHVQSNMVE